MSAERNSMFDLELKNVLESIHSLGLAVDVEKECSIPGKFPRGDFERMEMYIKKLKRLKKKLDLLGWL